MFLGDREAEERQEQERRQRAAGILQRNAASLGGHTDMVGAASTISNQEAQDAARHRSNVLDVVDWAGGEIAGGFDTPDVAADQPLSAVDQDYLNNPPGPGAEDYAGSQLDASSVYDAADSALADYGRTPMDRPTDLDRPMPPRTGTPNALLDPWQNGEDDDDLMYGGGGRRY